jgi:hypothetical protein
MDRKDINGAMLVLRAQKAIQAIDLVDGKINKNSDGEANVKRSVARVGCRQ